MHTKQDFEVYQIECTGTSKNFEVFQIECCGGEEDDETLGQSIMDELSETKCCFCLSFRRGMKLLFVWELFWLWCWYMTAEFMWNGNGEHHQYNSFNETGGGSFVTKSVPVILVCTLFSLLSTFLTSQYVFGKDNAATRLGLVVSSITMLIIAVVFVIGGVTIMWIDIVVMANCLAKTWGQYRLLKYAESGGYTEVV